MLAALRDTVSTACLVSSLIQLTGTQTSALLTSAVYALTQHPEVLARLRQEILSVCPQGHIPTHEDIRQLKYCEQVFFKKQNYLVSKFYSPVFSEGLSQRNPAPIPIDPGELPFSANTISCCTSFCTSFLPRTGTSSSLHTRQNFHRLFHDPDSQAKRLVGSRRLPI
jgi:hypothetical protein